VPTVILEWDKKVKNDPFLLTNIGLKTDTLHVLANWKGEAL